MESPTAGSPVTSPPLQAVKKVFSNASSLSLRGRNNEDSGSLRGGLRGSADSTLEKSPSRLSQDSSREGSSLSGSSGIKKLIPGHAKRKRRRQREEAFEALEKERNNSDTVLRAPEPNQSSTNLSQDGSSLLTDDSEPDVPPPLLSRDSHTGYLTSSSPLITTTAVDDGHSEAQATEPGLFKVPTASSALPEIINISPRASPSLPVSEYTAVPPSKDLLDRADTLRLPSTDRSVRRKSISSSFRGISPARRLKEKLVPSKSDKSPKTSPERESRDSLNGRANELPSQISSINERRQAKNTDNPPPTTSGINAESANSFKPASVSLPSLPNLDTKKRPQTPPGPALTTPLTTVTPPTPTENWSYPLPDSPRRNTAAPQSSNDGSGVVVSASGNMISHRRAKSQSSLSHQPSKLSNSILAPLTPTTEEAKTPALRSSDSRNVTPGGGFFSSWVSVAQNTVSTLTNTLSTQNRSRSATSASEPEKLPPSEEKVDSTGSEPEPETPKKQLAVETLGTGDLSFSHLGLDIVGSAEEKPPPSLRPDLDELRKNSTVHKDEAAAKIEDMLAKRAVSAAYEKDTQTPVAEVPDPMNTVKHTSTMSTIVGGDHNETNGSIFESETGSVRRNISVRSRMAKRRSRGSSGATGTSALGAMIGASTATLANPAAGPRLTGFAVAPKQRNRAFHQLFRSVPEDDYLIEDYSCALQRDILLAGRIYISEGHICFSSNILGWVTTLVISFEEVVSFEKETTAMVFPNAIAIQTLHARHTFRSLLSREATFDLLIGIWKASHPAAFQKSINGKQMEQEAQEKAETIAESETDSDAGSEEDEVYDEDEDGDAVGSFVEVNGSIAGSDTTELKSITRKPSALNGSLATSTTPTNGEMLPVEKAAIAAADTATDFPGPATHAPTDCSDSTSHYEKVIKDEIIPAPLGKIYSMLYGPASGVFVSKYLSDECKVTELVFEDDKKGLSNDNKTRQYTYIKPLGGSIGPKQTKCITTETLDAFDLEKAVSVTCTTQTPDVPNGSSFSVKTRYCLSWAPNNATRLQMNCGIEWTAKSWLKVPIEKGANDGQQTYGNDLVKALKAAVSRPRAATTGSKSAKAGKKRRKGTTSPTPVPATEPPPTEEDWGVFDFLRRPLDPVVGILKPVATGPVAITIIFILLFLLWFRGPSRPSPGGISYMGYSSANRIAAYEEMWRKEESELWDWLDARVGLEGLALGDHAAHRISRDAKKDSQTKLKQRQKILGGKNIDAILNEAKMSEREMEDAIRVTQERLHVLQDVVARRKSKQGAGGKS